MRRFVCLFGRALRLASIPYFASALLAPSAYAQGSDVVVEPPARSTASAPSPTPSSVTSPTLTVGHVDCSVGDHTGLEPPDARTTTDLVCHELARTGASGRYDVRLGKLGGRILLTVSEADSHEERSIFLQGFDEVPTAAPRIADALVHRKPIDQTQSADNLTANEARAPRTKAGQAGFDMTLIGATALNQTPDFSAGVGLGLLFRVSQLAVTSHGRAGGIGSGDHKLGFVSLDVGARAYLSDQDFAPFVGGGLLFGYYNANGRRSMVSSNGYTYPVEQDFDGSGLGGFAEVGAEILRTSHVGLSASFRADLPFYALEGREVTSSVTTTQSSRYVVPLSLNVGLLFH